MNGVAPIILSPLSAVYSAVVRSRRMLYERGTLPRFQLNAPVISVGNIITGGTGKTPLVLWLARLLAESGRKVCILTRGYGRRNPNRLIVVSDGEQVTASPQEAGDEAFLLATKLIGTAVVISNANRKVAGDLAIGQFGSDVFILDDGFQHLQLNRDLDVVTIDATNPWGNGFLLPIGRLREPATSLSRADCIVLTRVDQVANYRSIAAGLAKASGGRPIFVSRMRSGGYAALATGRFQQEVPEPPLAAFCGIGNASAFFRQIESETQTKLVFKRAFADHYWYAQKDVSILAEEARSRGARSLITTEKDAIKLTSLEFPLPCYALVINIEIEETKNLTDQILKSVF